MTKAKEEFSIWGDQTYHERARRAMPILVRQAESGVEIRYSELAEEIDMSNPRILNYPLGSIGETLKELSSSWNAEIPVLQCLVVNKRTGLPGEGIGWFITDRDKFKQLPRSRQKALPSEELSEVYAYPYWRDVLRALELPEPQSLDPRILRDATKGPAGPETESHKKLKEYVASNPAVVGLNSKGHNR